MILPRVLAVGFLSSYFIGIGLCLYAISKGNMAVLPLMIGFNVWIWFASRLVKNVKRELTNKITERSSE